MALRGDSERYKKDPSPPSNVQSLLPGNPYSSLYLGHQPEPIDKLLGLYVADALELNLRLRTEGQSIDLLSPLSKLPHHGLPYLDTNQYLSKPR